MSEKAFSKPVGDSVAKVKDEVAVGENLDFQAKWWKFERCVWIFFTIVILLDLAGAFGRGYLARGEHRAQDNSIEVRYDRIERASTSTILTVNFGPSAIQSGSVSLFVSDSLVKELGAQRIIPSPERAMIGNGGLVYTFPISSLPASVEFALEPTGPGLRHLTLQAGGLKPVRLDIFVVP